MSLTTTGYARIRELLLSEQALGEERISINSLSSRLGIGRTPVRDAVNRLAAAGLVKPVARSGILIAPLSCRQLRDIVELREALEPFAAERACGRLDCDQLGRLRELCCEMRRAAIGIRNASFEDEALNRRMRLADALFHSVVFDAVGNEEMRRIVEDHRLLLTKVRYPSKRTVCHLALTLWEHWRIYRAMVREDRTEARLWMLRHSRRGGREILKSWMKVQEERPQ